eukprot:6407740-Prymnesium_polylepis.1
MAPQVYSRPHGRPHGSSAAPLAFARARARRGGEDEAGAARTRAAGLWEMRRSVVTRNVAVQRRSVASVPTPRPARRAGPVHPVES